MRRELHVLLAACAAAAVEEKSVEVLSPTDAEQLKHVFLSGQPWLVQCGSKADLASAAASDVDPSSGAVALAGSSAQNSMAARWRLMDTDPG